MSPRTPKNVLAVTPGGDITLDMVMGFYALFTVPDLPVSASKLSRLWIGEGLPHELVPKTRKAVHGFQVACRSVETRRHEGSNRDEEIKVDEVLETPDECVYQITRQVRDRENRVIDHPKAMRVRFDKQTDLIEWELLDKARKTEDRLELIGRAILTHFEKNSAKVPGARVRAGIRGLMDRVHATNVRRKSGGVYFVPKGAKSDLDGLANVLEELYGDAAELHMIACANAEGEKKMVERHFKINVSAAIDEIMAEVAGALGPGRKMRRDRMNNLMVKRTELGQRRQAYAELLDMELDTVKEKLELLDTQLESLVMDKVDDA